MTNESSRKENSLFNSYSFFLFCSALILNLGFLYFNFRSNYIDEHRLMHGEQAYNMVIHGSSFSNIYSLKQAENLRYESRRNGGGTIANAQNIPAVKNDPLHPPSYTLHVGYSLVIAFLWKITGSFSFLDILILQILIFSFLMFLWYQVGYILFESSTKSLWCCIALLFFFPIIFLNVHVGRDIWHYYGMVFLLYGIVAYLYKQIGVVQLCVCFVLFAFCQFVRPPVFIVVITSSIFLIVYAVLNRNLRKKCAVILVCLLSTNALAFWFPYMWYNKKVYGQYLVGAIGTNLLQGISVPGNPWGYPTTEAGLGEMIKKKYDVYLMDIKFDEIARGLAYEAIKERPLFYFKLIAQRFYKMILPSMTWYLKYVTTCKLFKDTYDSFWDHIKDVAYKMMHDKSACIDIFFRAFYTRLFIILGYVGMFLLFVRRKYFIFFLLFGVMIASSYSIVLSHIEERYFIPAYAFFSFFVGYFIVESFVFIRKKLKLKKVY